MKSRCAEDVIAIDNLLNTQNTRITSTQLYVFVILPALTMCCMVISQSLLSFSLIRNSRFDFWPPPRDHLKHQDRKRFPDTSDEPAQVQTFHRTRVRTLATLVTH